MPESAEGKLWFDVNSWTILYCGCWYSVFPWQENPRKGPAQANCQILIAKRKFPPCLTVETLLSIHYKLTEPVTFYTGKWRRFIELYKYGPPNPVNIGLNNPNVCVFVTLTPQPYWVLGFSFLAVACSSERHCSFSWMSRGVSMSS